jgi:head-tail adaptor
MSRYITPIALNAARSLVEAALTDTAIIYRHTLTSDGMGGYSETWAASGTVDVLAVPVPQRRSNSEPIVGDQITSEMLWELAMPYDADVTAKDRVAVGDRIFEVRRVNNDQSYRTTLYVEGISLNEMASFE